MNNPRRGRGRSGRRPNIPTRAQNFDSNGPEGRVRGNAQQVYEKYLVLARDAQAGGDRVLAEAFQQHAEHYYRVMNDSTDPDMRPRDQQQGQQSRDDRDDGDEEFREERRGQDRGGQDRGGQDRNRDRGYERRDDRNGERQERRADQGRSGERQQGDLYEEASRSNGQGGPNGGRHAEQRRDDERAAASESHDAAAAERDGDGRETRMRERFGRRNGEGILTRRRGGDEEPSAGRANGGADEEADAGLLKMLGEEPRAQKSEPEAPAEPSGEADSEAKEATKVAEETPAKPAKPRRRRRTKAEIAAEAEAKEQSAE